MNLVARFDALGVRYTKKKEERKRREGGEKFLYSSHLYIEIVSAGLVSSAVTCESRGRGGKGGRGGLSCKSKSEKLSITIRRLSGD